MELHLKKTDIIAFSIIASIWLYSNVYVYLIQTSTVYSDIKVVKIHKELYNIDYFDRTKFLINTPGCYITNYRIEFIEVPNLLKKCGKRAVFVTKITDTKFSFTIDRTKLKSKYAHDAVCCYQYIKRHTYSGKEDHQVIYTKCLPFDNGTTATLKGDFINVICKANIRKSKIIYKDSYMLIKKVVKKNMKAKKNTWNVLMLGLDTMSRSRLYNSMPEAANYLQTHGWLDFRAYHKVASNTFPNLIAVLTGMGLIPIQEACNTGMSNCNKLFIWSKYSKSGYVTAYGEDFIGLPDTFSKYNGFKKPPTDHYTRPFFVTGENEIGNLVCLKTLPSAYHILNYALDFSKTYQEKKHFGLFWLNSYTHNINQLPSLLDTHLVDFFQTLNNSGAMENTFVFFFSDHGIRFGPTRDSAEAYYEERLPMLFIWVPRKFKESNEEYYLNLKSNQIRLIAPYDVYETLRNILQISDKSARVPHSEGCEKCTSLFNDVSHLRTCKDVNISDKWCSCHGLVDMNKHNEKSRQIIELAAFELQNKTKYADTKKCTTCSPLKLDQVLRLHEYKYDNTMYYVTAFTMKPGDLKFEVNLKEDINTGEINVIRPTYTISRYNSKGYCVKNPYDRDFCVCQNVCDEKNKAIYKIKNTTLKF